MEPQASSTRLPNTHKANIFPKRWRKPPCINIAVTLDKAPPPCTLKINFGVTPYFIRISQNPLKSARMENSSSRNTRQFATINVIVIMGRNEYRFGSVSFNGNISAPKIMARAGFENSSSGIVNSTTLIQTAKVLKPNPSKPEQRGKNSNLFPLREKLFARQHV